MDQPQQNPLAQVLENTRQQRNQALDLAAVHMANVQSLSQALDGANGVLAQKDKELAEKEELVVKLRAQVEDLQNLMLPEDQRKPHNSDGSMIRDAAKLN